MAPSAPGIPNRRSPPSKAGPAGQDAARNRVPSVTTTSVLVPMSMSIRMPSPVANSTATRSAAVSPPTWLAMTGAPTTRPCGFMSRPTSCPRRRSQVESVRPASIATSVLDLYGNSPIGAMSMPKNRSRIVLLATMIAS